MSTDELIDKVIAWGKEKGISDIRAQANKMTEEWGETVKEMNNGRFGPAFEDGIGDCLVVLIIYADIAGKDIRECLASAYEEIKNRSGSIKNGSFVKDATN